MKSKCPHLFFALLALVFGLAQAQPLSFGLFGDTPYNAWERARLPELMAEMGREDLVFIVHDGDIKSGSSVCSDAVLRDILAVFQASKHPLVYVPGDNEWTDCHRSNNGSYDPLERLNKLRELFFQGDRALGQRAMTLQRQSDQAGVPPAFAAYRENVRWQAGGALFVGLNLPGSENNYHGSTRKGGPVAEFVQRNAANQAWLAQGFALARAHKLAGIMVVIQANPEIEAAQSGKVLTGYHDFLKQLREETQGFAGQVVLVHGDSHQHQINQPLRDNSGKVLANFTRVETFGSPQLGWVKATVDASDPQVFRFSPRPWSTSPVQ